MASPTDGSGTRLPQPGSYITPQARDVERFFDPSTYHGKCAGLPPMGASQPMTELTSENIKRFFDQNTYRGKTTGLPPMGPCVCKAGISKDVITEFFNNPLRQKRPSESGQPPSKGARLDATELIEKFKLAAQLNGLEWDDIMVS